MKDRKRRWALFSGSLGLGAIVVFGFVSNCADHAASPPGTPATGGRAGTGGRNAEDGAPANGGVAGGVGGVGMGGTGMGGAAGNPGGVGGMTSAAGGQPGGTGGTGNQGGATQPGDERLADLKEGCVPSWPKAPAGLAGPPKATLKRTPQIRWTKKVLSRIGKPSKVVAAGNSVGFALGSLLGVVEKKAGAVKVWGDGGAEILDALTADDQGQFLVGGRKIAAVNEAAATVWAIPLQNGGPVNNEWGLCNLLFNRVRQLAVAACNDGFVYGIDDSKAPKGARLLWSNPSAGRQIFSLEVHPAIGDLVTVAPNASGTWKRFRIDAATGTTVLSPSDAAAVWAGLVATSQGALTATPSLSLVDRCGKELVKFEGGGPQQPLVLGVPGERVLVGEGKNALETLALYSLAGKRLAGPVRTGSGIAAGADGSFYAFSCTGSGDELPLTKPPELIAYDSSLQERWRLPLPLPTPAANHRCPSDSVVLDDDGSMYIAVEGNEGAMMHAVETDSPGPAPTPWYVRFADNRGSNWSTD